MNFELTCSKYFFTDSEKQEYEKMGFHFLPYIDEYQSGGHQWKINRDVQPKLIFDSIQDLKDWSEIFDAHLLIIDFEESEIEIYDDYRE